MSIDSAHPDSRWLCENCDWNGTLKELLTAPHPWHSDSTLFGCPECKWEDELHWACQVCHTRQVTSGTSTPDGYLRTCSEHRPEPTP